MALPGGGGRDMTFADGYSYGVDQGAGFGFVFARRGNHMEACSSWFPARLVGPMQAAEWGCIPVCVDAEEALKGWVGFAVFNDGRIAAGGLCVGRVKLLTITLACLRCLTGQLLAQ